MRIKSIKDLSKKELEGKKVFMRVDFNVPLDKQLNITDDSRIQASLPSIRYLIDKGARIILASHLGRPKGQVQEDMRMNPIAKRLSELIQKPVIKLDDCIGPEVEARINKLVNSEVALLENIRFYKEEEANDPDFSKKLASLADLYVNDAFGTAHRAHASTVGVTSYLSPALAGLLVTKELEMLGSKLEEPERPFTAIIGGSKISSKITVLKHLVAKVDTLIIGGGMAYTFIKAQGGHIGKSICEDDQLDTARSIMALADDHHTAIILPEDTNATLAEDEAGNKIDIFTKFATNERIATKVFDSNNIDPKWQGMDIGPNTVNHFVKLIHQSRTIVWNGPLGVFEYDVFDNGTKQIAKALVELTQKGGTTVIGGGDSVAALEKFNLAKESFSHVSTGGGASLEFLEGKVLPGVACLDTIAGSKESQAASKNPKNFAKYLNRPVPQGAGRSAKGKPEAKRKAK